MSMWSTPSAMIPPGRARTGAAAAAAAGREGGGKEGGGGERGVTSAREGAGEGGFRQLQKWRLPQGGAGREGGAGEAPPTPGARSAPPRLAKSPPPRGPLPASGSARASPALAGAAMLRQRTGGASACEGSAGLGAGGAGPSPCGVSCRAGGRLLCLGEWG